MDKKRKECENKSWFKNILLSKSKALNAVRIMKLENQHFATPNKKHIWEIIIVKNWLYNKRIRVASSDYLVTTQNTCRVGQDFYFIFLFFYFSIFFLLWLHLQHVEVPRLGVKSELQLPAYTTVMAVGNPNHSSWQHWILNPLARPGIEPASTWILGRFINHWATVGTPMSFLFFCVCFVHLFFLDF